MYLCIRLEIIWAWAIAMRVLKNTETNLALWGQASVKKMEHPFATMVQNLGSWGWHASRNHIYNVADGIWNGRLIRALDYANENGITSKVILKLPNSIDYCVMFNRIKSGMIESMNMVMITRSSNTKGGGDIKSDIIAKLGSGEMLTLPNFRLWELLKFLLNKIDLNLNPPYADVTAKLRCINDCASLACATLDT